MNKNVKEWISETRVRTEKQSKGSEIAAPTLNRKKCQKMDFRNSSQNRKAVKNERDSRSHTKSRYSLHTQISRQFYPKKSTRYPRYLFHADFNIKKSEKRRKKDKKRKKMNFRNSSQNREAVKIDRDSRSYIKFNTRSLATLFSISFEKKV